MSAVDRIRAEIERRGPIPFDEVVEIALYDADGGFYATGGQAGRRGDFITSPEIGPLFGAVIASALDTWWREMGTPDPYVVVEVGAGPGTLARTVLAAAPACESALRYVLVERSASQRARHAEHLRLEEPAFAFAPVAPDTEAPPTIQRQGPLCVSLGDMPVVAGPCIVLANELLDNLAFGLAERRADGWQEVHVGLELDEVLLPAPAELARVLDELAPDASTGGRVPVQHVAQRWLRDALSLAADGGRVVALDYASTTAEMSARVDGSWLRTYRQHDHGSHPLDDIGAQDITCEVAVDQLALVRTPDEDRSQAAFLDAHGIADLVAEGRRTWHEKASSPDIAALTARSRVPEADALLDPAGLGAFRVLEWRC